MEEGKVQAVLDWPVPRTVTHVQEFLGFANFYRRFIKGFAHMAAPLTDLTRKQVVWRWGDRQQKAFEALKVAFTTGPVLIHADPDKPFIIETDASGYAYGATLSQYGPDGKLHPIAFLSKSMTPAEKNYDIYDKEMLAIVRALEAWRHYIDGNKEQVKVITDHKNLEWFTKEQKLSGRQLRWIERLSYYDFVIIYRPGPQSGKPDALSRRPDHRPEGGVEDPPQIFLREGQYESLAGTITVDPIFSSTIVHLATTQVAARAPDHAILDLIRTALPRDPTLKAVLAFFANDPDLAPANIRHEFSDYVYDNDLLFFRDRIYVPHDDDIKRAILELRHDSPLAGHPGQAKTLELVSREYYWPSMKSWVNRYVDGCELCQRTKPRRVKPHGLLQPLPIPPRPWHSISYDFIPDLPPSRGHNSILVIVDRNTKYVHLIPTTTNVTASGTADLFIKHVWQFHGTPLETVSDRGTTFNSQFLRAMYKRLGITPTFSTAYHPQTDGQTERVNQEVEQFLRLYCNHDMNDWVDQLPFAQFCLNNRVNESTGVTPFYTNHGYHPTFTTVPSGDAANPAADDRVSEIERIQKELQASLELAQEIQKRNYDAGVREQPTFQAGEKVWLEHTNITTDRPSAKLGHRRLGPFPIEKRISATAYRLTLPPTMRSHPVFHVSLLSPYHSSTIPGHIQAPPPKIIVKDGADFEVSRVLNARYFGDDLMYEVRFAHRPHEEDSWISVDELNRWPSNAKKLSDFYERNPLAWSPTHRPPTREERTLRRG